MFYSRSKSIYQGHLAILTQCSILCDILMQMASTKLGGMRTKWPRDLALAVGFGCASHRDMVGHSRSPLPRRRHRLERLGANLLVLRAAISSTGIVQGPHP